MSRQIYEGVKIRRSNSTLNSKLEYYQQSTYNIRREIGHGWTYLIGVIAIDIFLRLRWKWNDFVWSNIVNLLTGIKFSIHLSDEAVKRNIVIKILLNFCYANIRIFKFQNNSKMARSLISTQPIRILFICCGCFTLIMKL